MVSVWLSSDALSQCLLSYCSFSDLGHGVSPLGLSPLQHRAATAHWMWELNYKESWMLKNWCFWTVVLENTFESPLDCKESNQSILKEISPECSLEGLLLKLKLQYFGHLMWRTNSFEKTLRLGKIEGQRRRGRQRMIWLDGITDSWVWVNSGSWW